MTVLWSSLIVVGALMIGVAVWPSIRSRRDSESSTNAAETEADHETAGSPADDPHKPEAT